MSKPRILDLFCGAGGAAEGYARAGFEVVGVDIEDQPHYPFTFWQEDALNILDWMARGWNAANARLNEFDAIHASPPCQAFTTMRHFGKGAGEGALDLIEPTRELLQATGRPYIIENVIGAPLLNPVKLCGSSFGLNIWRHRHFESNVPLMAMPCAHHLAPELIAVYGDHPQTSKERGAYRVRRARSLGEGQAAMGIDWMPWKPLTQAVPPAMTEHLGRYLLSHLQAVQKAAA